ncbi:MAG: LL-diaminopimelate aminotransferase [bacterium]
MKKRTQPVAARRLAQLPPYLFAELDRRKDEAIRSGRDVIDLGVGDPDLPTPSPIIRRLQEVALRGETHRYPSYAGLQEFREAIARWYAARFGITLDPITEVLVLIGSKEGLGHLPWALLDPGDSAIVPDPAYPVYEAGTLLAGGKPHKVPLLEQNDYLPDLEAIDATAADEAKLLYLNYPNNPTGAVAGVGFFRSAVEWAARHGVLICHDAAYTEIAFDGYRPPSLLSVEGAKEVGVEFHSLSKTFNMTGWRVGFVVGNGDVIRALGEVKKNVDSGVFAAIQYAGIEALNAYPELIEDIRRTYQARRDALVDGLTTLGWKVKRPKATFYVWAPVPGGLSSTDWAAQLLDKAAVGAAPGLGFGPSGEGYIRFSLTTERSRIEEAVERVKKMGLC